MKLDTRSIGFALFAIVFLYLTLWIFQGLDATDSGWHLTNQVMVWARDPLVSGGRPFLRDLWLLSDLAGGAWLSLVPGPSILWARLGGVLVLSLTAVIAYATLALFFDARRVFLVMLCATAVIVMRMPRFLIEYYTFPALLVTLALLLLGLLVREPDDGRRRSIAFLLGFLIVPIILSRLLLAGLLGIPLLIAAYHRLAGVPAPRARTAVTWVVAGFALSTATFAAVYGALGFLGQFLHSTRAQLLGAALGEGPVPAYHRPAAALALQAGDYLNVAKILLGFSACLALAAVLRHRAGARASAAGLALLTLAGSAAMIARSGTGVLAFSLIHLAIGLVIAITIAFLVVDRGRNPALAVLAMASTAVMILNPLGSADGIYKSIYGMWVALPLAALLTWELKDRIRAPRLRAALALNTAVLPLAALLGVSLQFTNLFRDDAARTRLVAPFAFPGLQSIRSTPGRVQALDAALFEVARRTRDNETVLVVGEIPVFHYLTRTRPFFGEPWIELERLATSRQLVNTAIRQRRFPSIVVFHRSAAAPWDPQDWLNRDDKYRFFLDRYLGTLKYELAWQNGDFWIFVPPAPTALASDSAIPAAPVVHAATRRARTSR